MEELNEKEEKKPMIEGSELLRRGDLKTIAMELGIHPNSVRRVYNRRVESPWIELAIKNTIAVRRAGILSIGDKVQELN